MIVYREYPRGSSTVCRHAFASVVWAAAEHALGSLFNCLGYKFRSYHGIDPYIFCMLWNPSRFCNEQLHRLCAL